MQPNAFKHFRRFFQNIRSHRLHYRKPCPGVNVLLSYWICMNRIQLAFSYTVTLQDIAMTDVTSSCSWFQTKVTILVRIRFCETYNRILKACFALKPEGDEKWKPRNSINSDQLCLTSTRHLWKMYRKWKFPNFQIYGFYDFFLFKSMKSTKNPQNSILCTYSNWPS